MSTNFRTLGVWLLAGAVVTVFFPSPVAAGKGGSGGGHGGWSGSGGGHMSGSHMGSGGHMSSGSGGWSHSSGEHGGNWSGGGASGGHGSVNHSPGSAPNWHGAPSWSGHGPNGPQHGWAADHHGDWHGDGHNWPGDGHNWHGGWDAGHAWWHDHGSHWVGWWQVGVGWPWFGFGWSPGYYGYNYGTPYYGDLYADYGYEAAPYTATYPPAEETAGTVPPADADPSDFYAQGLAAFQQGEYRNAARLAGHASIDDPRSPDVHLLLMQALLAIGEYRGSAMEAHAVVSLGKTPDWARLYGLYGAVEPYTEQLRALEKAVREKPTTPEARFLLGYQYLMTGHPEAAQGEFLHALRLTPKDPLAAQLLKQSGGSVPPDIGNRLPPSAPAPKTFDGPKKAK